MSKNKSIIIAAILIVVGIIGVLLCTIPSISKEQKVINAYINAINKCDIEGIKECFPLEQGNDLFGIESDYFGSYDSELSSKLNFLELSDLSAYNELPEDVKEIKNITLISTNKTASDEENIFMMTAKTSIVTATVKVTYITSDDKTKSFTSTETFDLLETSNGLKIISV